MADLIKIRARFKEGVTEIKVLMSHPWKPGAARTISTSRCQPISSSW